MFARALQSIHTVALSSAAALALGVTACVTGSTQHATVAPLDPVGTGERPDATWATEQLRGAALLLHQTLAREGSDGFLSLRIHADQVPSLFSQSAGERLLRVNVGVAPSDSEPRWIHFRALSASPLVGFCARGVRIAEPNGPDGLRARALVVDRLLIVGSGESAFWGAWIEGLILTENGWRLMPSVPFSRQAEDPRSNHADVQLWDCDLSQRPRRERPLSVGAPAATVESVP